LPNNIFVRNKVPVYQWSWGGRRTAFQLMMGLLSPSRGDELEAETEGPGPLEQKNEGIGVKHLIQNLKMERGCATLEKRGETHTKKLSKPRGFFGSKDQGNDDRGRKTQDGPVPTHRPVRIKEKAIISSETKKTTVNTSLFSTPTHSGTR